MDTDLKCVSKPLETLLGVENNDTSGDTNIYFEYLHLSPLKVK
jgi:hypothetical protein